jgi:hypothetical protein
MITTTTTTMTTNEPDTCADAHLSIGQNTLTARTDLLRKADVQNVEDDRARCW